MEVQRASNNRMHRSTVTPLRMILVFIPVARKWEVDESIMRKMISTFKDPRDPLWLALFPEGTDFTEQKCIRSQKYAAANGLPILNHVLLPKTKGFFACLEVYDLTIAYKNCCPTFMDNVYVVAPSEVHIHVQRINLDNIPNSEEEVNTWLINGFHVKDQMLSEYRTLCHEVPRQFWGSNSLDRHMYVLHLFLLNLV